MSTLQELAKTFKNAERNLTDDKDFIFSNERRGIKTSYRHEADNTLTVKLEGVLKDVSIFEEIAVLRETDLYKTWAPFCVKSKEIARFGFSDSLSWLEVEVPLIHLTREALYRGKGCDCINERGLIILVCQGIDDEKNHDGRKFENRKKINHAPNSFFTTTSLSNIPDDIELPPRPSGLIGARLELRCLQASIEVLSMNSIRTRIVTNFDPNLDYLPQWLFEFGMKKMAGHLLIALQKAARHAIDNPNVSPHAKRIREDTEFYKDFLVPRFEAYCSKMQYEMLPISAYDTDDKLENNSKQASVSFPVASSSQKTHKSRKRKLRKEEKMILEIQQEREDMIEFLKPKEFNKKQLERLSVLKRNRSNEIKDPKPMKNAKSSSQLNFRQKSSFALTIISLFVIMMTFVFGISRFYFERWIIDGVNDIMFLDKLIRTIMLLSINGVFHVIVLRTSLLTIFDAVEDSTASYKTLYNTKKLFSERIVLILIVCIAVVNFFSLFRALLMYLGWYLQEQLKKNPSFKSQLANFLLTKKMSSITDQTLLLDFESWKIIFSKLLNSNGRAVNDVLAKGSFEIFELITTTKEMIIYLSTQIFGESYAIASFTFMEILNICRDATIYFFDKLQPFLSCIIKEAPDNKWQRLAIDTANFWMSETSLFFVILSIGFSVVYTSPISKTDTVGHTQIGTKGSPLPFGENSTHINTNSGGMSQNSTAVNVVKDCNGNEDVFNEITSILNNEVDGYKTKKKRFNGRIKKKKSAKDDETDHTVSGISISSVLIPNDHDHRNFPLSNGVSEVSVM